MEYGLTYQASIYVGILMDIQEYLIWWGKSWAPERELDLNLPQVKPQGCTALTQMLAVSPTRGPDFVSLWAVWSALQGEVEDGNKEIIFPIHSNRNLIISCETLGAISGTTLSSIMHQPCGNADLWRLWDLNSRFFPSDVCWVMP